MKKLVALALAFFLMLSLSWVSVAERFDDGIPLSQKRALLLSILTSMWESSEWQRVEVPAGVYEVGVEIPEGEWTISNERYFMAVVGTQLDETKTEVDRKKVKAMETVEMEDYKNGWTVKLVKGDFIELSRAVVFTIPIRGLGFSFNK